jgi:hypothetical protein
MKAHIRDPRGVTIANARMGYSDTIHVGVRVGQSGKVGLLCGVYSGGIPYFIENSLFASHDLEPLRPDCKHCQDRLRYHNSPSTATPRKAA